MHCLTTGAMKLSAVLGMCGPPVGSVPRGSGGVARRRSCSIHPTVADGCMACAPRGHGVGRKVEEPRGVARIRSTTPPDVWNQPGPLPVDGAQTVAPVRVVSAG